VIARILCPVDFSPFSERAVRHASALAASWAAELTVLWVRSGNDRTGRESLQAFASRLLGTAPARLVTTDGQVVPEIIHAAGQADLIVMGTHGASGFERLLLGSVTDKVLRKAPCPVLTVPRFAPDVPPEGPSVATILCAVDFSATSARAFEYAASFAVKAGACLLLFHALEWFAEEDEAPTGAPEGAPPTSEQDARTQLEELIPDRVRSTCQAEVLVGYGEPGAGVLRVARERQADMIVLGVKGRGAIELTLFGSTAQRVVREASCPVLTVGPRLE
jgi:nucleotide-binding universal stress UspA family protein